MSEEGRRRVSTQQMHILLDFLSQHKELAINPSRTMEGQHRQQILWAKAARMLNACGDGSKRPTQAWTKYWTDFKAKLKKKIAHNDEEKIHFQDEFYEALPLTDIEKRAVEILGPSSKIKRFRDKDTEAHPKDPLNQEVKQETILHNVINNEDGASSVEGDVSEQQSDEEMDDGQITNEVVPKVEDDDSSVDDVEEDNSSDDPIAKEMYPQWLIDVEKKRAEAELRRAKAEELRGGLSVKTAEAAYLQSQAMKKLADAADKQAEAILRIANALESRRPRD